MEYRVAIQSVVPSITINKESRCFIGVSLENPNFHIKYFASIIAWAKKHFEHSEIVIADYVYRHTVKVFNEMTDDESEKIVEVLGNKKIEELKPIVDINPGTELLRWKSKKYKIDDDYISTFRKSISGIEKLQRDIEIDAIDFLTRKDLLESDDFENKLRLCTAYIIEEMAFINYQAETGNRFSIYPGTQLQVLKNISLNKYSIDLPLKNTIYIDLKIKK